MLFCTLLKGIILLSGPCMGIPFPQCTAVSQRSTYNGPYWEGLALGGAGGLGRLANLGRLLIRP